MELRGGQYLVSWILFIIIVPVLIHLTTGDNKGEREACSSRPKKSSWQGSSRRLGGNCFHFSTFFLLTQDLAAGKRSSVVSIGIVLKESFGSGVNPPVTTKT